MRLVRPLLLLCLLGAPLRAEPDAALLGQVREVAGRGDTDRLIELASQLAGGITLPSAPQEKPSGSTRGVEVRAGEIQAALTQLSILSGGNGHLSLQMAQASRTDVIDLISGTATLADLGVVAGMTQRRDSAWHLSRPLVIWPGAALVLSPGELLELDTAAGAFIVSFGDITVKGATLRGDDGRNDRIPAFRPFLLVTGQGAFRAEDSTFADLGFRAPVAFRGVSVLTAGLMRPDAPSLVADSRFERVFSLSFEGADGMVIAGNRFAGAGAAAISVKGGSDLVLAANRILATGEGAGIRLSGALRQVAILGNLIAKGGRNGLQVDGATEGLVLRANVITDNAEAGVSIRHATCLGVEGNIIAGNGASGLRLSGMAQGRIASNAILSNQAAGIEVQAQAGPALLSDNLIADNREGLRGSGLGDMRLAGNDLSDQLPRQFAGDFAPWLASYLTADAALAIPTAGQAEPLPATCLTE